MFDRFAGFFHAFGALERNATKALQEKRPKEAASRIFGKKYDSLPVLLDQLGAGTAAGDAVERYVLVLCAFQFVRHMSSHFPDFWRENLSMARDLEERIATLASTLRVALIAECGGDMKEYLDWFDRWFIKRATPIEVEDD